jgi:hypothetical protein
MLSNALFAASDHLNDGPLPRCAAVAVPERGLKTRVVTKSPWSLVTLGDQLRKTLFCALRREPVIQDTLEGRHKDQVSKAFDAAKRVQLQEWLPDNNNKLLSAETRKQPCGSIPIEGLVTLSSDLTAASDLLPLDLVEKLVEGFIAGSNWATTSEGKAFAKIFRVLTGQQSCRWNKDVNSDHRTTQRGILMGLPTTWFILNLVHLFWIDESVKRSKCRQSEYLLSQSAAICGDDLVAFWPRPVVDRYHELLSACQAKISSGKHYVSNVGRGIFTEEVFYCGQSRRKVPRK